MTMNSRKMSNFSRGTDALSAGAHAAATSLAGAADRATAAQAARTSRAKQEILTATGMLARGFQALPGGEALELAETPVYSFSGGGPSILQDLVAAGDGQHREHEDASRRLGRFVQQLSSGAVQFTSGAPFGPQGATYTPGVAASAATPLADSVTVHNADDDQPWRATVIDVTAPVSRTPSSSATITVTTGGTQTPEGLIAYAELTRELAMSIGPEGNAALISALWSEWTDQREAKIATALAASTPGVTLTLTGDGGELVDRIDALTTDALLARHGVLLPLVAGSAVYKTLATLRDDARSAYVLPRVPEHGPGALLSGIGTPLRPAPALPAAVTYGLAPDSVLAVQGPVASFRLQQHAALGSGPANVRLAIYRGFSVAVTNPARIFRLTYTAAP